MISLSGLCLATVALMSYTPLSCAEDTTNEARGPLGARAPLGKVVVFGDSVSDNGSGAWTVSNHTWPSDSGYVGHRFSNGLVWVEDLAQRLGMQLDDSAVGGATSNNSVVLGGTGLNSTIPVPSAVDQVASYLKRSTVDPKDLFVIMIGANDILLGLTVHGVIPAITDIVYSLHNKGATKFLVASYPNLGQLPLRASTSNSTSTTFEKLSLTLQRSLLTLRYQFCRGPGIQVGFVDIYSLFRNMMLTPTDYGMDPNTITKSCLVGAYSEAPHSLCNDPDKYIFWDEFHPTRVAHKYMGALAWKASQVLCSN